MPDVNAFTEQWGLFEVVLSGPSAGNPFVEVQVGATFVHGHRTCRVNGFYDGGGTYWVRFMPDAIGEWTFTTDSNVPELAGHTGEFLVTASSSHGPVRTQGTTGFVYADGTPHRSIGTTCYNWVNQPEFRIA